MGTRIRPLEAGDHAEWRRLWTLYLEFYETSVSEEVYHSTWHRLLSNDPLEPVGVVAEDEQGGLVGLVHYLYHRHCWRVESVCYLQDLYVDADRRGIGVGQDLIESVFCAADAAGCPTVYWTTQHFNEAGRRLYDRVGQLTPFIKYIRP